MSSQCIGISLLNAAKVLAFAFLVGAFWLGGAIQAQAALVTYTYTGLGYTDLFHGSSGTAYTTSDSISGYLIIDDSQMNDLEVLQQVTPDSYSFSDGVQTFSNTIPMQFTSFWFQTDSDGIIGSWEVKMIENSVDVMESCNTHGGICNTGGFSDYVKNAFESAWNITPGAWSGPAVVPIPAAVWLFGSALAGLGFVGNRRRKQRV